MNPDPRTSTGSSAARGLRRILVAVDTGEPARWATQVAARFAQDAWARVMLVHVVVPVYVGAAEFAGALAAPDAEDLRRADELVARTRQALPPTIESETKVRQGASPANEIVAAARDWDADLIVMGTRGHGRLAHFILGSTTESVIRQSPCPVVTVGHPADWAAGPEQVTTTEVGQEA